MSIKIRFYDKQPRCEKCRHPQWTTLDGDTYYVCEMDPTHLENCINYMLRKYDDERRDWYARGCPGMVSTNRGRRVLADSWFAALLWWVDVFDKEVERRGQARRWEVPEEVKALPLGLAIPPQPEV